jgi:2-haloacid dehalogenase
VIDFAGVRALTFDCYGTLIDWETGILRAIKPVLSVNGVRASDEELLALYATIEPAVQAEGYRLYREVLAEVLRRLAAHYKFELASREQDRLGESVQRWPAFPDTKAAFAALGERFTLAVLSNIDDDLFAGSVPHLGREPDRLVTAELCRSYKPNPRHFRVGLALLDLAPEQVVHVAQSRFHDIVPARALGIKTVWVNRRSARPGTGATPPAGPDATPDMEVPDLASLVRKIG